MLRNKKRKYFPLCEIRVDNAFALQINAEFNVIHAWASLDARGVGQFIIHNDESVMTNRSQIEAVVSIMVSGTVTADRCYTRLTGTEN